MDGGKGVRSEFKFTFIHRLPEYTIEHLFAVDTSRQISPNNRPNHQCIPQSTSALYTELAISRLNLHATFALSSSAAKRFDMGRSIPRRFRYPQPADCDGQQLVPLARYMTLTQVRKQTE